MAWVSKEQVCDSFPHSNRFSRRHPCRPRPTCRWRCWARRSSTLPASAIPLLPAVRWNAKGRGCVELNFAFSYDSELRHRARVGAAGCRHDPVADSARLPARRHLQAEEPQGGDAVKGNARAAHQPHRCLSPKANFFRKYLVPRNKGLEPRTCRLFARQILEVGWSSGEPPGCSSSYFHCLGSQVPSRQKHPLRALAHGQRAGGERAAVPD